jgi:hypothetical protein
MSLPEEKIIKDYEKKEILSIFKQMWQSNNSPLHRMYDSWEELETHVEIKEEKTKKNEFTIQKCPYCETKQQVRSDVSRLFPYQSCNFCNKSFFIEKDYTVRKLTHEEIEKMPNSWIQIIDGLEKKKLSIIFKIE